MLRCGNKEVLAIVGDVDERQRAEHQIRATHRIARLLADATSLPEALRACLDATLDAIGLSAGGDFLIETDTGDLLVAHHRGLSVESVQRNARLPAGSEFAECVLASRPWYYEWRENTCTPDMWERRQGLRASGVLPIMHQGRTIGYYSVGSDRLDASLQRHNDYWSLSLPSSDRPSYACVQKNACDKAKTIW